MRNRVARSKAVGTGVAKSKTVRSKIELSLNNRIRKLLRGKSLELFDMLVSDREIQALQDYANTVSIKRLHYNDHGPVHMRKVAWNALTMVDLLTRSSVRLSLEREGAGTLDDSRNAILLASFLHDVGMSVGRADHERMAILLAMPIMERLLLDVYGGQAEKRVIVRSLAVEGILGHMTTQKIHSLEAGIILVADGCDMGKGRARIPLTINTRSQAGDIHKYSASAIKKVTIEEGSPRPIRITVRMSETAGFFQVEEVLIPKINSSPIKSHIELFAGISEEEMKRYL